MWVVALLGCRTGADPGLTVFAASSLTDVLPEVGRAFGVAPSFVFDGSSRLAKQLESGAAADLFFSADAEWMDWLAARDLIRADTRRDLLGNHLVLVVPVDSSFVPSGPSELVTVGHLAMAGENVPVGRYGREALAAAGVWDAVATRVVSGDNVRTALGWVATGEADAAVVYTTDARIEPRVKVAFTFPVESHAPIVYPAAVTRTSDQVDAAAAFLAFCATEGRPTFEAAGFALIAP